MISSLVSLASHLPSAPLASQAAPAFPGLLAPVAAGVVLCSLLTGFVSHVAGPRALDGALRAHRVLPPRAVPAVTAAVPAAEGLLGAGGLAAVAAGSRTGLVVALAAAAALFGTYAGYLRYVLATGRGGPCGCSRADVPVSGWAAGRALAYALLAACGAVLAEWVVPLPAAPAGLVTAGLAVAAFTALLWVLPLALHDPAGRPAKREAPSWTS